MTSKALAVLLGKQKGTIQKATKRAIKNSLDYIQFNGAKYAFRESRGVEQRGKYYEYKELKDVSGHICNNGSGAIDSGSIGVQMDKKVVGENKEEGGLKDGGDITSSSGIDSNRVNGVENRAGEKKVSVDDGSRFPIGVGNDIKKLGADDKLAIVSFVLSFRGTIKGAIASLNIRYDGLDLKYKRVNAWINKFRAGGRDELINKSKYNAKKIDDTLLLNALYGCGKRHFSSAFNYYCLLWCEGQEQPFNPNSPMANIKYDAFLINAKRLIGSDKYLKSYINKGIDGLEDMELVMQREQFGINEEWQIDATRIDFMCIDSRSGSGMTDKSGSGMTGVGSGSGMTDKIVRLTAIAVIDMGSRARVWGLFDSANSYANVRLLKKAIETLGKPMVIRGDNGADFVSAHFQGVLGHLGIAYYATRVGKGRDKGAIERGFRSVQHSLAGEYPGLYRS